MTAEASEDYCRTCGKPKSNHPFRHAFVGVGDSPALIEVRPTTPAPPDSPPPPDSEGPVNKVRISPPGDSVLRLALLRAGVITVADLETVESELKTSGVAYHEPKALG